MAALANVNGRICTEKDAVISVFDLVPIIRVDGHVIGSGQPGAITRTLPDRFRAKALELSR